MSDTTTRIKSIPTSYHGCRFRSRLEARWAVFFDTVGLEWRYEPEGFELDGGLRYLPDFEIVSDGTHFDGSDFRWFVEVKPDRGLTIKETQKAWWLSRDLGCHVSVFHGTPSEVLRRPRQTEVFKGIACLSVGFLPMPLFDVERGIDAAQAARFEFGECG